MFVAVDPMFQGIYNGKQCHTRNLSKQCFNPLNSLVNLLLLADLANVIERARRMGMQRLILTAGTLEDTVEAIKLCNLPEYSNHHHHHSLSTTLFGIVFIRWIPLHNSWCPSYQQQDVARTFSKF